MVENFNMDIHVGIEQKPPFYAIAMKKLTAKGEERFFIVMKKVDIGRSPATGMLDLTGFWICNLTHIFPRTKALDNLIATNEVCSVMIPINNIDHIKNLMYRPR